MSIIIIKNSDEDPHIYFSGNTTYKPETYWYIKQYDKGNQINFVANKEVTAGKIETSNRVTAVKMKYQAETRDVTSTGIIMKTMIVQK